jgi:hypothetical protein
MRLLTPVRLRTVGILLLEAAALAPLIAKHMGGNVELRSAILAWFQKARTL